MNESNFNEIMLTFNYFLVLLSNRGKVFKVWNMGESWRIFLLFAVFYFEAFSLSDCVLQILLYFTFFVIILTCNEDGFDVKVSKGIFLD